MNQYQLEQTKIKIKHLVAYLRTPWHTGYTFDQIIDDIEKTFESLLDRIEELNQSIKEASDQTNILVSDNEENNGKVT